MVHVQWWREVWTGWLRTKPSSILPNKSWCTFSDDERGELDDSEQNPRRSLMTRGVNWLTPSKTLVWFDNWAEKKYRIHNYSSENLKTDSSYISIDLIRHWNLHNQMPESWNHSEAYDRGSVCLWSSGSALYLDGHVSCFVCERHSLYSFWWRRLAISPTLWFFYTIDLLIWALRI